MEAKAIIEIGKGFVIIYHQEECQWSLSGILKTQEIKIDRKRTNLQELRK